MTNSNSTRSNYNTSNTTSAEDTDTDTDFDDDLNMGLPQEYSQDEVDDFERRYLSDTNLGYQRVLLPEGATRSDAIYYLSKQIPTNEYQLPTFFYRSDLLPQNLDRMSQDDVDLAAVTLYYEDGYPTFGKSRAQIFWNQLPHEPYEAFSLFQRYLDQAEDIGLRQLQMLSMDNNISLDRVSAYALEYYWGSRSRAYDLFQVAAERKRRELRVRKTEDKHFQMAGALIQQITSTIEEQGETFFRNLAPREALDALARLITVQRISMGEHQNGTAKLAGQVDAMAGASGSDIMRDLTKNIAQGSGAAGIDNNLRALMSDPQFALQAQSLIIQVRRGSEFSAGSLVAESGNQSQPQLTNITPNQPANQLAKPNKVIENDA